MTFKVVKKKVFVNSENDLQRKGGGVGCTSLSVRSGSDCPEPSMHLLEEGRIMVYAFHYTAVREEACICKAEDGRKPFRW